MPRRTLLGFLGPNGAVKTTAMRAVFGLVRLDAGEVRWEGQPVPTASAAMVSVATACGLVRLAGGSLPEASSGPAALVAEGLRSAEM